MVNSINSPFAWIVLYAPHYNEMSFLYNEVPINLVVLIGLAVLALIFKFIHGKVKPPMAAISSYWEAAAIGVLLIMIVYQVYCQHHTLVQLKEDFQGQTTHQKYSQYLGKSYMFSKFVLSKTPGPCAGELLSDYSKFSHLEPYVLIYFLYPKVNLLDKTSRPDCLIVYEKLDPQQYVSDEFEIVGHFNPRSLVAIRKKQ